MLPAPLAPLAAWPQFVAWRIDNGRKLPYSPITGQLASSTNAAHWATYEIARAYADSAGMAGVGFVFTAADPFWFLDVDKALVNGQWSQLAQEACALMASAAVEISQSGAGLHIIGRYTTQPQHRNKNTALGLELYTQERFVALTGTGAIGDAGALLDGPLAAAVAKWFTPETAGRSDTWTTEACAEWAGPADDDELLAIAMRSKKGGQTAAAAFGGEPGHEGPTFAQLWAADADALAKEWPGTSGPYDASSADQSLANSLSFWTGRNCERMERLMRRSALARTKWDDRPDYLETTILKATAYVSAVYTGGKRDAITEVAEPPSEDLARSMGFQLRSGHAVASHDEQMRMFAGCIYVAAPHKIVTPRGQLYDQGRFDAMYGGWQFKLDLEGKKLTTSAWEAFTRAQAWIPERADYLCFRPERGSVCVIEEGHLRLANTYVPAEVETIDGDPSPMVDHIRKMLPDGDDAEILLTYMASCVQHPGMKAQWWPIVQGGEGNFKTTLLNIMQYAVGEHYYHGPDMRKLVKGDARFNGWIERKLFLGLDEVYAADRREFFEGFKTTVTNRSLAVEGKGIEETTTDNRANGMIVTNHKDGAPITKDNRRYAVFFTAHQTEEDLLRDGITGEYRANLADWVFGKDTHADKGEKYGLKVMAHYLRTRKLDPRFDPRTCARAPQTTSTLMAIEAGRGSIEQAVQELIDQDEIGFAGGWVSSNYLNQFFDRRRDRITPRKRDEIMRALGYAPHPKMNKLGQTDSRVMPDNKKVKLYCKVNSIAWHNLDSMTSVCAAYTKAQSSAAGDATSGAFNAS